jgi:hypothetical protein
VKASAAALLALLLSLALAGCGNDGGGGGGSTEGGTTTVKIPAGLDFPNDKEAAQVLDDFVQAAGRTDYDAMFGLISTRTKATYGETSAAFARRAGKDLAVVLGAMARQKGEYEHVMAKRLSGTWSIAAIKGNVTSGDETVHGAYAVPLRREKGKLKVELAGTTTFNPVTPEPELKSNGTPDIATELSSGEPVLRYYVWVDETPYPAVLAPDEILLTSSVTSPLPKGRHVVVTYAETQSSAAANAYSFEVG